ncbi:MAG: hypothetical protein GX613_04690 [Chloroflexi bacterium]|nr:hypothetical protein [Chloroflexota bacterium]
MDTQPVQRPPQNEKKSFSLGKGTLIIGLLIFVGIMFVVPQLFGDDDDSNASIRDGNDVPQNPITDNIVSADIGDLIVASGIDQNGCAVDETTTFSADDTVYIVAEDSNIPASTTLFVRLYANGEAVEDSQELTADSDYTDTCANFLFETVSGERFETGAYEAELFVNGNPYGTVSFEIR